MTNIEMVSVISSSLKYRDKDSYSSDRYILSVAKGLASTMIANKLRTNSIINDYSLYREIPCIEFEPVDVFKCEHVEFRNCKDLVVSKCSFKDILYTRRGPSIKGVMSIDRNILFYPSSLHTLRLNSQRAGESDDKFFYLLNDKIYIPHRIKKANVIVLSLDQYELDLCNSCEDDEVRCESAWDKQFVCPEDLISSVIQAAIQQISIEKNIPTDENPNLNSNEK